MHSPTQCRLCRDFRSVSELPQLAGPRNRRPAGLLGADRCRPMTRRHVRRRPEARTGRAADVMESRSEFLRRYSLRMHRPIADDWPVSTRYRSVSSERTCRSAISGSGRGCVETDPPRPGVRVDWPARLTLLRVGDAEWIGVVCPWIYALINSISGCAPRILIARLML